MKNHESILLPEKNLGLTRTTASVSVWDVPSETIGLLMPGFGPFPHIP